MIIRYQYSQFSNVNFTNTIICRPSRLGVGRRGDSTLPCKKITDANSSRHITGQVPRKRLTQRNKDVSMYYGLELKMFVSFCGLALRSVLLSNPKDTTLRLIQKKAYDYNIDSHIYYMWTLNKLFNGVNRKEMLNELHVLGIPDKYCNDATEQSTFLSNVPERSRM